jgi:hypothetical protein
MVFDGLLVMDFFKVKVLKGMAGDNAELKQVYPSCLGTHKLISHVAPGDIAAYPPLANRRHTLNVGIL